MPEPMKTHDEIQREAQRLVALGRSYRDEQRQLGLGSTVVPMPRVLVRLPDSMTTSRQAVAAGADEVRRHRWERYIEAAIEHDELVYRLQERETVTNGAGRLVREEAPASILVSHSGFDLLHTGYEMAEEDRLGELLAPYADYSDGRGGEAADERTVAEVEEILGTIALPPSDRLRAKAEVVEFLEGRLEPSLFIDRLVDRQCAREGQGRAECQTRRQEMRLSAHES